MQTFKREIETILAQLMGNPWSIHPDVQEVIEEYRHLAEAARTPTQQRRVSLQIFHACRAIDTFLAHIVDHEAAKPGRTPCPPYLTLRRSLNYISEHSISGSRFTGAAQADIHALTNDRNHYLHRANVFPLDTHIRRFLMRTTNALKEATTFPT